MIAEKNLKSFALVPEESIMKFSVFRAGSCLISIRARNLIKAHFPATRLKEIDIESEEGALAWKKITSTHPSVSPLPQIFVEYDVDGEQRMFHIRSADDLTALCTLRTKVAA